MSITRTQARDLIEQYVAGWIQGDESMICSPLCNSCVVIESHGDTFSGLEEIRKWIESWVPEGTVERWEIKSFCFENDTCCFEWDFHCTHKGVAYPIYGVTFAKFENDKIVRMCEYKITAQPEKWLNLFE